MNVRSRKPASSIAFDISEVEFEAASRRRDVLRSQEAGRVGGSSPAAGQEHSRRAAVHEPESAETIRQRRSVQQ